MNNSNPTTNPSTNHAERAPWVEKHELMHPYGKCQCGCGKDAPIAKRSSPSDGLLKDAPVRFISGHNRVKYSLPVIEQREDIPYGYCQCGCGEKTRISTKTDRGKAKQIKGEPLRYIDGHGLRVNHSRPSYPTIEIAFWKHVSPGQPNECWEWQGCTIKKFKHGQFRYKNKGYLAHRVSYEIHIGPIPDGVNVCHSCDNPSCINPAHLFLGSQIDNIADMIKKGRNSRGEHHSKKFTDNDVLLMRSLADEGISIKDIADRFDAKYEHIRVIVRRKSWKHLP